MKNLNYFLMMGLFTFFLCFTINFNESEMIWMWKNQPEIPNFMGAASLILLLLYTRGINKFVD